MRITANLVSWIHGNEQIVAELLGHLNSPAARLVTKLRQPNCAAAAGKHSHFTR
jgi:hypothetical protein